MRKKEETKKKKKKRERERERSVLVRSEMCCQPKVVPVLSDQQRADVGPTGLSQHGAPEVSSEAKTASCWVDITSMHMSTWMSRAELDAAVVNALSNLLHSPQS